MFSEAVSSQLIEDQLISRLDQDLLEFASSRRRNVAAYGRENLKRSHTCFLLGTGRTLQAISAIFRIHRLHCFATIRENKLGAKSELGFVPLCVQV